jgi:hypothetical protein
MLTIHTRPIITIEIESYTNMFYSSLVSDHYLCRNSPMLWCNKWRIDYCRLHHILKPSTRFKESSVDSSNGYTRDETITSHRSGIVDTLVVLIADGISERVCLGARNKTRRPRNRQVMSDHRLREHNCYLGTFTHSHLVSTTETAADKIFC